MKRAPLTHSSFDSLVNDKKIQIEAESYIKKAEYTRSLQKLNFQYRNCGMCKLNDGCYVQS